MVYHYLGWELVFTIGKSNSLYLLAEKTFKRHCGHQWLDVADTNYRTLYSNTLSWREKREKGGREIVKSITVDRDIFASKIFHL